MLTVETVETAEMEVQRGELFIQITVDMVEKAEMVVMQLMSLWFAKALLRTLAPSITELALVDLVAPVEPEVEAGRQTEVERLVQEEPMGELVRLSSHPDPEKEQAISSSVVLGCMYITSSTNT